MTYLSVGADILEKASNTSELLVEVVALLQGRGDGLENFLILLAMRILHLGRRSDVVFKVATRMFVGLQSLLEELGHLFWRQSLKL